MSAPTILGNNVSASVEGNTLTLAIDLDVDLGPSKSGKTSVIATTRGNREIPGFPGVKLGLNLYKNRQ